VNQALIVVLDSDSEEEEKPIARYIFLFSELPLGIRSPNAPQNSFGCQVRGQ
jgi:hypothetical protein